MYLLGYIPRENRLYLGDKELNVVSFSLLLSVLEYQTAVMRRDFDTADKVLPTIPREQRTRVAHFLEKQVSSMAMHRTFHLSKIIEIFSDNLFFVLQGFKSQALAVTTDSEHKFDLAIQLGELKTAYALAKEAQVLQSLDDFYSLHSVCCVLLNKVELFAYSRNRSGRCWRISRRRSASSDWRKSVSTKRKTSVDYCCSQALLATLRWLRSLATLPALKDKTTLPSSPTFHWDSKSTSPVFVIASKYLKTIKGHPVNVCFLNLVDWRNVSNF